MNTRETMRRISPPSRLLLPTFTIFVSLFSVALAQRQPDVLMIFVDDLRPMLGCYGNKQIKTPNIDSLARRSVVFERAYCQYAKCGTSRLSVMTGLRPDSIGVFSNRDKDVARFRQRRPNVSTLPKWLGEHGYRTHGFGKIQHDGWDVAADWTTKPFPGRDGEMLEVVDPHSPLSPSHIADRHDCPAIQSPDVADEHLFAGRMTQRVLKTMRRADGDAPSFWAVGYRRPHLPFVAPKRYFDLYQPDASWLAKNQKPPAGADVLAWFNSDGYVGAAKRKNLTMPTNPSIAQAIQWNGYELRSYNGVPFQGPIEEAKQLEILHAYAACVSYVDAQIGLLLAELKLSGRLDDTVIVLLSDHGWHLGEHSAWGKMTNYEIATRVPLLIAAPGIQSARTRSISELVDLYPTVCELAGGKSPEHLEGESLVPKLRAPVSAPNDFALSQYARFNGKYMGRAIRDNQFRYVQWGNVKSGNLIHQELYDHNIDPDESANLIGEPHYGPEVKRLRSQLIDAFFHRSK